MQVTGREVVAYDRLGFGRSGAYPGPLPLSFVSDEASGSFKAVRHALELEQFVLFGHSVGGGMAIATAGNYPDVCVALLTESAQAFVEDRTLAGIRAAQEVFAQPQQLQRLFKYHGEKAPWVLNAWIETWLSEGFRDWNLDQALGRVTCPTLAIHGEQDEYGSIAHPQRIVTLTQGAAELSMLPGCGHVPHREHSDVVLERVRAFLSAPP